MRPSSVSINPPSPLEEQQPSPSSLNLTLWAGDDETDDSYDSSQLQPSPSVMSVSISEDSQDAISFRRPGGSSLNKLGTGTLSVSPSMSRTSLYRLVTSPALRPSESSSSSSSTSSAETTSSFPSSFSEGLPSPSQPSSTGSPSSIVSLPLPPGQEIDEESVRVVGIAPRTISTLLDTAPASVRTASRSPIPTPIPPRTHTVPPEGTIATIATSVSAPDSSGGTEQASLRARTVSERPLPPTPRDFALELDRLAEDLHGYNDAQGQENKEIVDNVKGLRDELQGLSEYSRHMRTRPPDVVRIVERPIAPGPRPMESRSVGGSTEITALHHRPSPEEMLESVGAALTRISSVASSVESFLSSHHSDDLSLYGYHSSSLVSPMAISDMETEDEDESSFVSSSEVTESEASEVIPATLAQIMPPMPTTPPEIMPTSSTRSSSPPTRPAHVPLISVDWMTPINAIMDQLDDLAKKQAATVRKMDSLRAPEYPEIPAIHHKIGRVEDLVRGLIQKFESRPSQPVMVPVPIRQPTIVIPEPRPPSRAATIHDQLPYS